MTISDRQDISVYVQEARERANGKRVIDHVSLEISDNIPASRCEASTDNFKGVSFSLTFAQAGQLLRELSDQIEYCKSLQSKGLVTIKMSDIEPVAPLPADEGHEAFKNRKTPEDNPYPSTDWRHNEWQFGWDCEEQSNDDLFDWSTGTFKPGSN